jgi:MFS family permease
LFCFAVTSFFGQSIGQWTAAFFVRSYGLGTGELGTYFSLIYGVGGLLGTYLGGQLASRHAAHNEALQLRAMAVVYCLSAGISAFTYVAPGKYAAFGALGAAAILGATCVAPLFATIQTLVPDRMRAMSIALIYLFANLIGMGLGPLVTGALSDLLHAHFGEESLRYSLLAMSPGYLWGAWHLWRASRTATRDLSDMPQTEAAAARPPAGTPAAS